MRSQSPLAAMIVGVSSLAALAQVTHAQVPVPAGQWHTLRVEFTGPRFSVMFDGQPLFEVEDATFAGAGMVGLWTKPTASPHSTISPMVANNRPCPPSCAEAQGTRRPPGGRSRRR